jgi:RNA polymerase sigma-70 factor (sigma-E family)
VVARSEVDFHEWVAARRASLRRTAFLLCGDWYLADDLVQDMLVRMYAAWGRMSRGREPDAYARRVLLNLYLDHGRRPGRRDRAAPPAPELGQRDLVVRALSQLPPGQRAVLVLRYWEDLSVEQTASALNTSPGNVKSQTSRGLVALRAALVDVGLPDAFAAQEGQP